VKVLKCGAGEVWISAGQIVCRERRSRWFQGKQQHSQ